MFIWKLSILFFIPRQPIRVQEKMATMKLWSITVLFILLSFSLSKRINLPNEDWKCVTFGKGIDLFDFTEYGRYGDIQFYVGEDADVEDTFLGGHYYNNHLFTFTTNYYWHGYIWYSTILSFNGTANNYQDGIVATVFPDKIGYLHEPSVEKFYKCPDRKNSIKKSIDLTKTHLTVGEKYNDTKCFTDGKWKYYYYVRSKDLKGNLHLAGAAKSIGEKDAVVYGHYQPRYNVFTFHIYHAEDNKAGPVYVIQYTGNFQNTLMYEINYPNMYPSRPNITVC